MQKKISKWAVLGTLITAIVLALIVGGMYTWYKISPGSYIKFTNRPILKLQMKTLRASLVACNQKYGADKYLYLFPVIVNQSGTYMYSNSKRGFLPTIYEIAFRELLFPSSFSLSRKEFNKIRSCVRDISPLRGMKLEQLNLKETAVHDLEPLRGMPLKHLFLPVAGYDKSLKKIIDLSPLQGMKLISFSISDCLINDISILKGMPLETVLLENLPVSDISVLKGMPLKTVHLENLPVSDISVLKGMPLEGLCLSQTQVTDLSPLENNTTLETLNISLTGITDLNPLAKIKTLRNIYLHGSKVTDLTPLFGSGITIHTYRNGPNAGPLKGTPKEIQEYLNTFKLTNNGNKK